MSDHSELKRLAKAATPGPWQTELAYPIIQPAYPARGSIASALIWQDAHFIAAANPAAVLALIAELEQAQLIVRITCNFDGYKAVLDDRDQLKAEVEALRKDAERYKWLSVEGNWVARMFGKWRAHVGEYGDSTPTEWHDTREEAIDAAMAKGDKP